MPRGDGTGPAGMGPMSGRGAGCCVGFVNRGAGFRARMGRGPGAIAPRFGSGGETEQTLLKNRAEALKTQLDAVQQRLGELEKAD